MAETGERASEVRTVRRDGVVVDGADAATWLQGQVSQDVEGMGLGDTRFALLLTPQGKAVCVCRVTRESPDRFVIDTDAGAGSALYDRLKMFKLRVKATLESVAIEVEERLGGGWEALGRPVVVGTSGANDPTAGTVDGATYEYERILAGVPRTGSEITESTIPQEAGDELMARAVSFTKGCYTGQELVARVDARGSNVPRRLRVLVGEVGDPPGIVGGAVLADDNEVGTVTSVASLDGRPPVALAYLKRSAAAVARSGEGGAVAHSGDAGAASRSGEAGEAHRTALHITTHEGPRPVRAFEPGDR